MAKRKSLTQIRTEAKVRRDVITFDGGRSNEDSNIDGRKSPSADSLADGYEDSNMDERKSPSADSLIVYSPVKEDELSDFNDDTDSPSTSPVKEDERSLPATSLDFKHFESDRSKDDYQYDGQGDDTYECNGDDDDEDGSPTTVSSTAVKMAKEDDDNSSDDGQGGDNIYDDSMDNVELAMLTDTTNLDVDKALVIRLLAILIPLKVFLSTRLGGGYSETKQGNCALRLSNLLVWTALNSAERKVLDETTLLPWMEEILRTEYTLVDSYCQYLEETKLYAASTIRNYLYDYG